MKDSENEATLGLRRRSSDYALERFKTLAGLSESVYIGPYTLRRAGTDEVGGVSLGLGHGNMPAASLS